MNGNIFDMQRFCVHDGPGIRTTVFFKGCPLRCVWCHNPESQKSGPSVAYYAHKCALCGACANKCETNSHSFANGEHTFNRTNCTACGKCAKACPFGAIELLGKTVSAAEVIDEVMRDQLFYKNSGGGVTFSGGEPLMQPAFLAACLTLAKEKGLHTCIETCGFASEETIKRITPLVDLVLFDIKETDDERHRLYTGVSSQTIINHLRLMDDLGAKIVLRCPIIPNKNLRDGHLCSIARLAASLKHISEVQVMAFHTLGSSKYEALSMLNEMKGVQAMPQEQKEECITKIAAELKALGVNSIKVC